MAEQADAYSRHKDDEKGGSVHPLHRDEQLSSQPSDSFVCVS